MRTDEALWEKVKKELLKKNGGMWSARLAQQSVREYKKRGGGYIGEKNNNNSLTKWGNEQWQYAGEAQSSRYLPRRVIETSPRKLLARENALKKDNLGRKIPYSKELTEIMRRNGIFL